MSSPVPLGVLLRVILAVLLFAGSARGQFVTAGPELRMHGFVNATESDPSGNVYLGGSFNEYNGDSTKGMGLLKLAPDGTQHEKWDIAFIDGVSDLMVRSNFLYVAGSFTSVRTFTGGTLSRSYLIRIFLTGGSEGKIDPTWAPLPDGPVSRIESNSTSLFMSGDFSSVSGTPRSGLAKLAVSTGAVDLVWNPAPNNVVADIELVGSQLYVSGGFSAVGGRNQNYLARLALNSTGPADSVWLPQIDRPVGQLESADNFIYFGGDFTQVEGVKQRSVARISATSGAAVLDETWNPDPNGEVSGVAVSGTDVYLSGDFTTVRGVNRRFMAKVSTFGGLYEDFLAEPNGAIQELRMVGSNVLAGGSFHTTKGVASAGFALIDPNSGLALAGLAGTISTEGEIHAMQPVTGGMIIGGRFDSVNGITRTSIAKILSNGTLDTAFNIPLVGVNRLVSDMKLDGQILYFCGDFIGAGGTQTQHIARANPALGTVDPFWRTKPLAPILCLESDATYVYMGSAGLSAIEVPAGNAVPVFNLARLSKSNATLDTVWTPVVKDHMNNAANAAVADLQINGSKLLISGSFASIANPTAPAESYPRISVASLATTNWGQPDAGWATEFHDDFGNLGYVSQLLLHNSSLYVVGNFTSVESPSQGEDVWIGAAKLNPSTGEWDKAFDVSPAAVDEGNLFPGAVSAIVASGSALYVAGDFDYTWDNRPVGGGYKPSPGIVRVNQNSGVPDPSWYPYPNDSVNVMGFVGSNLWMFGSFDMVGDTFVEGPAIVMPFSSMYQTWLNANFTPTQLADSDFTAPFLDLDGDGLSNLMEATFNTNPFNPRKTYHTAGTGTSGLPLVRMELISGQQVLTIEYTRWKAAVNSGVSAVPQFGDDLVSWARSGTIIGSPVNVDANRERVKFRDTSWNLGKDFGRVKVELLPP